MYRIMIKQTYLIIKAYSSLIGVSPQRAIKLIEEYSPITDEDQNEIENLKRLLIQVKAKEDSENIYRS